MRATLVFSAIFLLALMQAPICSAQQSPYSEPERQVLRVSLLCRDIEATSKLWAEILGVSSPKIEIAKPGSRTALDFHSTASHAEFRRAFLQIGGTTVEFLQPVGNGASPETEFVKNHPAGVQRVLFGMVDPMAVERFKKLGLSKRSQGGRDVYADTADKLGVATEWIVVNDQASLNALIARVNPSTQDRARAPYAPLHTLIQVALVTSDFEGLNQRWAEILGVPSPTLPTNAQGHWLLRGRPTNAYNESTRAFPFGNLVIEILHVAKADGGSLMTEFQEQRGDGVQHFCFAANDIDAVVKHFQEFGLDEGMASVQPGTASQRNPKGSHFIAALDKLGVDVELLWSAPEKGPAGQ